MQRIDLGSNRFVGNLQFLLSMPYLVEIHLDGNRLTGAVPPVFSGPLQVRSTCVLPNPEPVHEAGGFASAPTGMNPKPCTLPAWLPSCAPGAAACPPPTMLSRADLCKNARTGTLGAVTCAALGFWV